MSRTVPAPRIAVYARQSVEEEQGIAQQVQEIEADLERRGWLGCVVDRYRDNDTSGSSSRAVGTHWARMLGDLRSGKINTIAVVAPDRLTRNLADLVTLRDSARVLTTRGGIDTEDSYGSFMLAQLVLIAEQEIRTKNARIAPFKHARHSRGVPTPGRTPYGYRWIPESERRAIGDDDARYAVVPEEVGAVRYMFREAVGMLDAPKGIQVGAIARALSTGTATDAHGALLPKSTHTTRDGAAWLPTTVRKMLLSPYYAGLLPQISAVKDRPLTAQGRPASWRVTDVDIDACIPGNWEPLIQPSRDSTPADVLRAVRRALLDTKRARNGGSTAGKWLLSGIAVCGKILGTVGGDDPDMQHVEVCGAPVTSGVTRERNRGYRCPRGHFHIRGDVLDAWAVRTVLERLERPDAAALLRPAPEIDTAALRVRESALDGRRGDVLTLVGAGRYTLREADAVLRPIEQELASVRATLDAAYRADPLAEIVEAADVRAYWESLSLARRRAVLSSLMSPVISPTGKGWKVVESGATGRQRNADEVVRPAWRRTSFDVEGLPVGELTTSARGVLVQPL
ncbi:recombinase family protein [Microbacterium sp. Bi128]|uniref:recombinase family protein n=1 Tax=Microbacterium sp. Bi128 TaxID=2821115 RepID=UPI001D58C25D|nr:recombinase family protein [Microbacterium sp. Bi128]CAH0173010.1 hypothetical protein SRABI128_01082 [Microbacterium sp. Bi128]